MPINIQHKVLREMLKNLPLPAAREILELNLPEREWKAIYYCDCEQRTLIEAGYELGCEESQVKKIRRSAYEKLAFVYLLKP